MVCQPSAADVVKLMPRDGQDGESCKLVRSANFIPSHANEKATRNGEVLPGSRTAAFIKASAVPVHVPLSGKTLSFDATGKCVAGC